MGSIKQSVNNSNIYLPLPIFLIFPIFLHEGSGEEKYFWQYYWDTSAPLLSHQSHTIYPI